jgi:molybdate transport system substrate-binding protein
MRSRCTIPVLCTALATALLGVSAQLSGANCSELKIFGSRVTKMIVAELGPQFERASGYTPVVVADVAAVMKRRIDSDEPFDLAVLVDFQTDELIKSGRLVAETRTDVMKTGIGVAVKRGATRPDIGTVDAFMRTLLDARSITYLKEGASTLHLVKVLAQLGIADALKGKTITPSTESVSEMVAAGEAEIGIIVIPNILSVPGAELVGPLPDEIQSYITFTAAVSLQSANQSAAREVIKLMQSPAGVQSIKRKGMQPG